MVQNIKQQYAIQTTDVSETPESGNKIMYPYDNGSTSGEQWRTKDSSSTIDIVIVKHNYSATVAPAVGDDVGDGYSIGSIWIDTTNGDAYICEDNSSGAAAWLQVNGGGGGGFASGLTINADDAVGADPSDNTSLGLYGNSGDYTDSGLRTDVTDTGTEIYWSLGLDINGLTAEATVDGASDYVGVYDASAGLHRKVLLNNLPSGGGGAPTTAQYVTLALDGTLSAERVLTAGTGIDLTDGGANGNATLAIDSTVATLTGTQTLTNKTANLEQLFLEDASEVTIATGAITVTKARHTVDTEGDAAQDDLDTINGTVAGEVFVLHAANGAREVTLTHNVGNVMTAHGSSIALDDLDDAVLCVNVDGTNVLALPFQGLSRLNHAERHITGATDEIDGDKLDIDFTPSNYTPSTAPAEADNVDNLTAHLSGIDTALASAGGADVSVSLTDASTQSVATATNTALNFDTENYDTDGFHDTVTNNTRITIPSGQGGKYQIFGAVRFDSNATGVRQIFIRLNGTTTLARNTYNAVSGTLSQLNVFVEWDLAVSDYIELVVNQNSGSTLNSNITENCPIFVARKVG